ncbi:60S ribosomal protein L6 [Tritrichomonas foetus]|uniref:60S ribosomal protein L6 n=1 Tax=Tritrichomonas foetus TaxID=1144522 RepID=A0A1J4JS56_9EUKA|nr:60S ribosomal protein L6 [Tritrichomonas foetus]|eukprot:OHT01883.1 60S ribosomal protein L6 [Tritrichomonas foetus]
MAELLFIAPVEKKDPTRPTWRGIPRVSFTRPAVAAEIDPIAKDVAPTAERKTRDSLSVGTVVIILDGEHKGRRAVVVQDAGNGLVKVNGPSVPTTEVDQDYLIATSTKLELGNVDVNNADGAVKAAAAKVPEMVEYLNAVFSLRKGERPHLMKF